MIAGRLKGINLVIDINSHIKSDRNFSSLISSNLLNVLCLQVTGYMEEKEACLSACVRLSV